MGFPVTVNFRRYSFYATYPHYVFGVGFFSKSCSRHTLGRMTVRQCRHHRRSGKPENRINQRCSYFIWRPARDEYWSLWGAFVDSRQHLECDYGVCGKFFARGADVMVLNLAPYIIVCEAPLDLSQTTPINGMSRVFWQRTVPKPLYSY
jgi:hypothetical protein